MKAVFLMVFLTLVGCRGDKFDKADDRILCDEHGTAFNVIPGVGDTSFVQVLQGGEAVCAGRIKGLK